MPKQLRIFFTACLVVWLTGCSSILTSDQPPDQVYWLEPSDLSTEFITVADGPRLRVTVAVVPGLDTDRILIKGPGPTMSHYAGARWPDSLPELIQSLLVRSLESTGLFLQVAGPTSVGSFESEMRLELREFFAIASTTGSGPKILMYLQGNLECGTATSPIGARATSAAAANRLHAIVEAHQRTLHDVIRSLATQYQRHCAGGI